MKDIVKLMKKRRTRLIEMLTPFLDMIAICHLRKENAKAKGNRDMIIAYDELMKTLSGYINEILYGKYEGDIDKAGD